MTPTPTPKSVVDAYLDAWNRHDMDAYEALFGPDSHFISGAGLWWKERHENVDHHRASHGAVHRDSVLEAEDVAVLPIDDGSAAVIVRWRLSGLRDEAGVPVDTIRRGTLLFAVGRTGDRWTIRAGSNTPVR